jgi:DNA-binding transcriptional LysR family regulator
VNVTRLRMLSEVAGRGSFRAAAAALDYTPSAVSQQIALLEREVGHRLVDRSPHGAQLTEAGIVLVRHADVALDELDRARQELAALSGAGALRVAAFPTATATIVALAARSIPMRVMDAEPDQAHAMVANGEVDAAVVYGFEPDGNGDLIGEDPMLLCLPADHPLTASEEVDLADLAREQWFAGDACPWIPVLVEQCRAAGFTPAFSLLQTNDYAAMQALAATHGLVGLIPMLALAAPHPGVAFRRLRPPPRPRTLRYAIGAAPTPAAERLGAHLRAALGQWSLQCRRMLRATSPEPATVARAIG